MLKRLLTVLVLAISLTACGGGGVTVTKKIINSDNGVSLIEYTVKFYETLLVFRQPTEDMAAMCDSGTATALPAAPAVGVPYVVSFTDCLVDDITLNGSVTVTFSLFNSWTDMAYTLDLTSLMAAADWFGGTATFVGELDYSVLDMDATITLMTTSLVAEVPGDSKLVLSSLSITANQGNNSPELTFVDVSARGEISSAAVTKPIAFKVVVAPLIRINTVNTALICPTRGYIKLESVKDGSFASIEYPSTDNNVYWVGTNLSYTQKKCT